MTTLPKSVSLSLLAWAVAAASLHAAENFPLLQKGVTYFQSSSAAPTVPTLIDSWNISISSATAATLTPPGLAPVTLNFNSNDGAYQLDTNFPTKAELDAEYPNGTFTLNATGSSPVSLSLTGDTYPVTPQVVSISGGATWQNGVLVIDPAVSTTITINNFATYGAGTGSHENYQISSQTNIDSVNLKNDIVSVAFAGLSPTATPFTTITIPAGTLHAGGIYNAYVGYDQVITLINSPAALSLYDASTQFFIVGKSATAVPNPILGAAPANQSGPLGSTINISVPVTYPGGVSPPPNTQYQWYFNGEQLSFQDTSKYGFNTSANGITLTVKNMQVFDFGTYGVMIINGGGMVMSQTAIVSLGAGSAPSITNSPANQTANVGGSVTFGVSFTGTGPFTFQWKLNGTPISGATNQTYNPTNIQASQAGTYTVTVTNSIGSATSNGATLTVNPVASSPTITKQPSSQTIASGSTVVFSVITSGFPAPTYRWQYNGADISGATASRYVITNADSTKAGNYSCIATNVQGSAISNAAALSVITTTNPGRLVNLSILSQINGSLTMGFVNGGNGTNGSEPFLIRAIGPSIGPGTLFNVPGVMADPTLKIIQQAGGSTVASNSGWGTSATAVIAADNSTGAFALTNTSSLDSALVTSLPGVGGGYGAQVAGKTGGNGYALTEVYDATVTYTATSPRLVNLSCLTSIAAGGTLNVGFVVGGVTSKTFLVRVSGPSIAVAPFNVPGTMPDPRLSVAAQSSSSNVLASNAGWGGDGSISGIGGALGAFAFTSATSKDSAVLLTVPPVGGGYSVTVSSVSNAGGAVLVEVYEVP